MLFHMDIYRLQEQILRFDMYLVHSIKFSIMARFSKKKPEPVMVRDRKLVCPVCENDQFIETRAQLNTAVASFFDLDFANKEARCFVCSNCTYIFWFRA